MTGSTAANRLYSYPARAEMSDSTNTYRFRAESFETLDIIAPAGGGNCAFLYDTPGEDRLEADLHCAALTRGVGTADQTETTAAGFTRIYAYSTRGGADTAELTGAPLGGNTYRGCPAYSTLYDASRSFYHYARGFRSVTAVGSKDDPSSDRAYLYDSSGDDTFDEAFLEEGKYQGGVLADAAGSYEIWIKYFDLVYARSMDSGTNDTIAVASKEELAYNLIRFGTW